MTRQENEIRAADIDKKVAALILEVQKVIDVSTQFQRPAWIGVKFALEHVRPKLRQMMVVAQLKASSR